MKKRRLLLLHGALGAATQFNALQQQLEDTFDVSALNFPGHGGTGMPKEKFSFPLFASPVLNHIDEVPVNIFGYSMGGYAALWIARYFPGRLNKIFTLGTKLDWNPE